MDAFCFETDVYTMSWASLRGCERSSTTSTSQDQRGEEDYSTKQLHLARSHACHALYENEDETKPISRIRVAHRLPLSLRYTESAFAI